MNEEPVGHQNDSDPHSHSRHQPAKAITAAKRRCGRVALHRPRRSVFGLARVDRATLVRPGDDFAIEFGLTPPGPPAVKLDQSRATRDHQRMLPAPLPISSITDIWLIGIVGRTSAAELGTRHA